MLDDRGGTTSKVATRLPIVRRGWVTSLAAGPVDTQSRSEAVESARGRPESTNGNWSNYDGTG